MPPRLKAHCVTLRITSRDETTTPAFTSLWPLRYFVPLCTTASMPNSRGVWLIGEANVLSIALNIPRSRASLATAARSTHRNRGLEGDST